MKDFLKKFDFGKQAELPEDRRKTLIFNIFVGAIWIITAINAVQNLYLSYTLEGEAAQEYIEYNSSNFIFLVILGFIWIGHIWFPRLIRHTFIILMVMSAIYNFRLVDLNQLFVIFALPIIMAAFLIGPIYSFVYWLLIWGVYTFRLYQEGYAITDEAHFPFLSFVALFVITVVSWLISYALDKSLDETRALNRELDQRVQDRTRELAEALQREHATAVRNKTILDSIADGVVVFDTKHQVMVANPAANQLAGYNLQSLGLVQLLKTIDEKASQLLENWINGRKPDDLNNVKFEWGQRTISANVAPVTLSINQGAEIDAGNVMVLRDFTKEAELEKAKAVFLGMVSHELRTPMSAIKGYVNILLNTEQEHLTETGLEYLQTIDVSIKQLLNLANELIDLSRMESGEIELYREWVYITPIVNQAVKMVQPEFIARDLTLEVQLEENLPQLYVDKNRILQILLNLLSNAYKYTVRGGATLRINQADPWVIISVSDTGVGIKPSDQSNLFNRFFRSNDRQVQQAGGTGLGLNISKGLTELHGGQLTYVSQYGVGTIFQVSLPRNPVIIDNEPKKEETYAYSAGGR
jgi:signal transduction histidine kinase